LYPGRAAESSEQLMPDFGPHGKKPTLRDRKIREGLTKSYLVPGDRLHSDTMVICIEAPRPFSVPNDKGHVQTTDRAFLYLPGSGEIAALWFDDIDTIDFSRKDFNSRLVVIAMRSGERWAFDVFPQTARVMKRWFRRRMK
jgi:hypothetical protein